MLDLTDDLLAHLNDGGTLIVPTRQRAAAVRLAHTAAQLAAGRRTWHSPDVLSWSGWIERALDAASLARADAPRRLRPSEEWLWWREAVEAAGTEAAVPFTDALVESVRRAVQLLDDHALPLRTPTSPESTLLLGARREFRQRCAERGVLGTTSWHDLSAWIQPLSATRLVGFAALGPARRRWLEQLGATIDEPAPSAPNGMSLLECSDADSEAAAAADWCAGLLGRDPYARVLVVVPRLAEAGCRWQRALDERLGYRAILDPGWPAEQAAFALEGGAPLRSEPVMASALQLIALGAGRADFDTLSAVLRSPYCDAVDGGLDCWRTSGCATTTSMRVIPRCCALCCRRCVAVPVTRRLMRWRSCWRRWRRIRRMAPGSRARPTGPRPFPEACQPAAGRVRVYRARSSRPGSASMNC